MSGANRPQAPTPARLSLLLLLLGSSPGAAGLLGCAEEADPSAAAIDHGACASASAAAAADPFADCVLRFDPAAGASFGHAGLPEVVLGRPVGGGTGQGGSDVASLGCGGEIVLGFAGAGLLDGPGDDLLVFENPFNHGDGQVFAEPAELALSDDGVSWHVVPCRVDVSRGLAEPGCAGRTPVLAAPGDGRDPTDPGAAGGDAFDLATVGLRTAHYLRLVDRTAELWGAGSVYCQGVAAGFDLDAVAAVP